jgi:hypothetical protein
MNSEFNRIIITQVDRDTYKCQRRFLVFYDLNVNEANNIIYKFKFESNSPEISDLFNFENSVNIWLRSTAVNILDMDNSVPGFIPDYKSAQAISLGMIYIPKGTNHEYLCEKVRRIQFRDKYISLFKKFMKSENVKFDEIIYQHTDNYMQNLKEGIMREIDSE